MKRVLVLLSSYNGESFIRQQIESILCQEEVKVSILVRDDGSRDRTVDILEGYIGNGVRCVRGENLGPFKSFLQLVGFASDEYDYYAFADQDDLWMKDKLISAIRALSQKEETDKPCLYCADSQPTDEYMKEIKSRKRDFRGASVFATSLIRNVCQGNTCMINKCLMHELKKTPENLYIEHDRWSYILCLALGGIVVTDDKSYVKYRQHGQNYVGYSISVKNRIKRRFNNGGSASAICSILKREYFESISPENLNIIEKVIEYKNSLYNRIVLLNCGDFYKVSLHYRFSFVCSVVFGMF